MEPKEFYIVESGGVTKRVIGALVPLPQPTVAPIPQFPDDTVTLYGLDNVTVISGSEFAAFQPRFNGTAMIWIVPGATGVLSARARTIGGTGVDVTGALAQGVQLAAGQPRSLTLPIFADVVYTLEYSVACTVTVGVSGTPRVVADPPAGVALLGRLVQQVVTLFDGTTKGIATNDTASITCTGDRLVLELQLTNTTSPSATVSFQIKGPVGLNPSPIFGADYSATGNLPTTITLTTTTPKVLAFEDVAGITFVLTLTAISGINAALTAKCQEVA